MTGRRNVDLYRPEAVHLAIESALFLLAKHDRHSHLIYSTQPVPFANVVIIIIVFVVVVAAVTNA